MEDPVHYLKLAYLAEISIVFNLAYVELKWRKVIQEIKGKLAPGVALVPSAIEKLMCKKKKCAKCFDGKKLAEKFERYDGKYLNRIAMVLYSEFPDKQEENNHQADRKSLVDAWSLAQCKLKYVLLAFHVIIRAEFDRKLSLSFLGTTTAILMLMTMADNHIDIAGFNLLYHLRIWKYAEQWIIILLYLIVSFIIIQGIFWILWRIFLGQYECLNVLLSQAYQNNTEKDFATILNEMRSVLQSSTSVNHHLP